MTHRALSYNTFKYTSLHKIHNLIIHFSDTKEEETVYKSLPSY